MMDGWMELDLVESSFPFLILDSVRVTASFLAGFARVFSA